MGRVPRQNSEKERLGLLESLKKSVRRQSADFGVLEQEAEMERERSDRCMELPVTMPTAPPAPVGCGCGLLGIPAWGEVGGIHEVEAAGHFDVGCVCSLFAGVAGVAG